VCTLDAVKINQIVPVCLLSEMCSAFAEELHRNICPTLTSVMEAPLVSFVRDGHEQKLELWKQDRQKLQRWQRIQQIGLAASPLTLPAVKVEESAGIEELPKLEVKKQWLSNLTGLWY
jgi:hypothetical protein